MDGKTQIQTELQIKFKVSGTYVVKYKLNLSPLFKKARVELI